jgi:hypothetical protein
MKLERQELRRLAWAGMGILYGSPLIAGAQSTNEIPPLRPPHAEIPPTFWEQHAAALGMGGFALLAFIGLAIWLAMRPRTPVLIPPAVQARGDLESLRLLAEDGRVLSKVTQAVRRYFGAAFALPPGELTTAEFCRALAANDQVGSELSTNTSDFLRRCDERKFAPDAPPEATGAAECALRLVAQAEHHREQVRRAAQANSESIAQS